MGVVKKRKEHIKLRILQANNQPQPVKGIRESSHDSQIPLIEWNSIQKPNIYTMVVVIKNTGSIISVH